MTYPQPTDGNLLMRGKGLSDQALTQILEGGDSPLTRVELGRNSLTSVGASAILDSPRAASLKTLDLQSNKIGDAGLSELAKSKHLGSVKVLFLSNVGASDKGVIELAKALEGRELERLSLDRNAVGDRGAKALAGSGRFALLHVEGNRIGDDGAKALLTSDNIVSLHLSENAIGDGTFSGLETLGAKLKHVSLAKTRISDDGVKALASCKAPTLESLDLTKNPELSDGSVEALANAEWLGQLKLLEIVANKASPEARRKLIAAWGERRGLTVYRRDLR